MATVVSSAVLGAATSFRPLVLGRRIAHRSCATPRGFLGDNLTALRPIQQQQQEQQKQKRRVGVSVSVFAFTPISFHAAATGALSPPSILRRRSPLAPLRAAASDDAAAAEKKADNAKTVVLIALFGAWYLFNIFFNIYNKQVLKVYPYPITCTLIQFAVGACLVAMMWITKLHAAPKQFNAKIFVSILPLAAVHTLGNLLTNVSLGKVAVSFTHTIKAMEPFFSVLLSSMFLGDVPSLLTIATLVPIVGGVVLASVTEVSFNWSGFLAAMGSNLTFQSRNVLSKKLMGLTAAEGALDNINLFSIITLMSLVICFPVTLLLEGVKFTPSAIAAYNLPIDVIVTRSVLAGLCFHAYQQVSYMILQRVSPVSHSVGNCVKRVVVIAASVFFFRNPVSPVNAVGTGVALVGVYLYTRVKRAESEKMKALKLAAAVKSA